MFSGCGQTMPPLLAAASHKRNKKPVVDVGHAEAQALAATVGHEDLEGRRAVLGA